MSYRFSQLGDYGRGPQRTLPLDRSYFVERRPRDRGLPGPRNAVIYPGIVDQLGFSLKPPRFIRKLQPGVILKKAAIPLAVVGATLLIPGAGGVIASGLIAAAKGASSLGKSAVKVLSPVAHIASPVVVPIVKSAATNVATSVVVPILGPMGVPQPVGLPVPVGASTTAPGGSGGFIGPPAPDVPATGPMAEAAGVGGGNMPGWILPAAIAAGVMLFASRAGRSARAVSSS